MAPRRHVGYEEGGALTEAVRRRPYQVVLFDEIEKAHPDVFNVLLQVLDDGRLTDGQGHTVDFRNTLIIMTSNLGSQFLVRAAGGRGHRAVKEEVMTVVRALAAFRPEFPQPIGNEIILFHRLKREQMGRIIRNPAGPAAEAARRAQDRAREESIPRRATGSPNRATIRLWGAPAQARDRSRCRTRLPRN